MVKAAPLRQQGGTIRRYQNINSNKENLYGWLGKSPTGQQQAKQSLLIWINPQ
jgi:hypothetical protein